MRRTIISAVAAFGTSFFALQAMAEEVVNIYSARHYQTDDALYGEFEKQTGIMVKRIEGGGDELIERMRAEGENSPADVFIAVDVGNLWRADQAGVFGDVSSPVLDERIPENLRHPTGRWFGFASRARLIYYNKELVNPEGLSRYEDLTDPKWKGEVCIRSSSNIYNTSLLASIVANEGAEAAEAWAKGVVANMARDPQGGDTDQLKAAAIGECGIAVANSYYFARLKASEDPELKAVADSLGVIFPNQGDRGTHVNISGAGVAANAPNRANAIRFLEYMASESAQRYFADGNNEYPVAVGVAPNAVLRELGPFKVDSLNISAFGVNQAEAQRVFDRAGWK